MNTHSSLPLVRQSGIRRVMRATLAAGLLLAGTVLAAVPDATIYGPIAADPPGHPSKNSIYSASAIDLDAHDYIEEEYFIEG